MKKTMITGLMAAALSTAMLAATAAQAEPRTFLYGTYGAAKYDGTPTPQMRKAANHGFKRDRTALRPLTSEKRQNFSTGSRKRTQIKISR